MGISPGRVSASGGERKVACDGKTLAPILSDDGRELQGAESIESSSNRCGMTSTSSLCSRHGPKHCQVVALCVEAAAGVFCSSVTYH
jgi:hypothetical protein